MIRIQLYLDWYLITNHPIFRVFCIVLYTIITVFVLIGNSVFCYVLLISRGKCIIMYISVSVAIKKKYITGCLIICATFFLSGLKTITYRLLVNLSLSDILIALLSGAGHVTHTWIIGNKLSYNRNLLPNTSKYLDFHIKIYLSQFLSF